MPGVDHRQFGIAAPAQKRADPVAGLPAGDALPDLIHFAGDLEAQNIRRTGRGGIIAQPLQEIGPVDPRGADPDANLAGDRPADQDALLASGPRPDRRRR
jgi:hypothetical protein